MATPKKKPAHAPDDPANPWPAKLRRIRHKLGERRPDRKPIPQGELALKLGVTRRTIINWEQGRTIPTGPAMVAIDLMLSLVFRK